MILIEKESEIGNVSFEDDGLFLRLLAKIQIEDIFYLSLASEMCNSKVQISYRKLPLNRKMGDPDS
jgi:hypothetical protein